MDSWLLIGLFWKVRDSSGLARGKGTPLLYPFEEDANETKHRLLERQPF